LDVLFDILEIEGFDVCGPMFGEILEPMYSSSACVSAAFLNITAIVGRFA
jgi:hypothetical protein